MTQTTLKLDGLKVDQLKSMAKILGLKGYSKMKQSELVSKITDFDMEEIIKAYSAVMNDSASDSTGDSAKSYPFASSNDVPKGAYCSCGEPVPLNEDNTLSVTKCDKCELDFTSGDVDFSTVHGQHVIVHQNGQKPEICPLDGERIDGADKAPAPTHTTTSNDVASATTNSREGVWTKAEIDGDVLNYENSVGVAFSLNLSELDKLKARFGDSYGTKALVKSIELACVPGCDSTWSPRASFVERIIEAIKTGDDIPMIHPVDPRHNDCWASYCRSGENMLASARMEKFETPTAEELSELKKHPWSIIDDRVYHNSGDPTMSFSFNVADTEENPSAIAHLHKCHGPRCKFMIRTYAGWGLEQARKAEAGENFAFLSSFAPKHESCKQQAKEIRDTERAELETQEPASESVPASKIETQAPAATKASASSESVPASKVETQTPAPVTPAPAAVAPEPVPAPKTMPDVHASAPAEFADAPVQVAPVTPAPAVTVATASTSDMAQVIASIATVLQSMPQYDQQSIPEIMRAAAEIASASQSSANVLGDVAKSQSEKLGKVAEVAQSQLGDVIKKLIEERTATVRAVDDIPRRVRSEIFGDMETPGDMHEVGQRATGSRPLSVERPSGD